MAWSEGLRDPGQTRVAGIPRGHQVVLAGPGTGKTFVLVRRVENLVEVHGLNASRIACLTFTRAAAAEMRERLDARLGDVGRGVRVSTLHSFALRELLRAGASDIPDPVRVVGDWEERWVVVEELARVLNRKVREITNERGTGALDLLADDWESLAADNSGWEAGYPDPAFLGAWRRHRQVYGYTLRAELVYQLLCELRSNPEFEPGRGIDVLLVDEYQDLNRCDLDTVAMIAQRANAEVFAAGDDDQSIYSFRHAHPAGIRNFVHEFECSGRLTMTECLRCGPEIVDIANWLIQQEVDREPKELRSVTDWGAEVTLLRFSDQDSEADGIARIVDQEVQHGTPEEEILVLLRSDGRGQVSKLLDEHLVGHGHLVYLPRRSGDLDPGVQTLLEYLILCDSIARQDHIDDLALRSLLELEGRVGDQRRKAVVEFCVEGGVRFYPGICYLADHPEEYSSTGIATVKAECDAVIERAGELARRPDEDFTSWLGRVCDAAGLAGEALDDVRRVGDQILAEIELGPETDADAESSFVQELLAGMTNLGDTLPPKVPGNVTITTMHGAKGLSADVVIVLQVEDELIPGEAPQQRDEDEARRLLYVSLTRARKRLLIGACHYRSGPQAFAGTRQRTDRHVSRFIRDYGLRALTVTQYLSGRG